MVDAVDSKSTGGDFVPVRVRPLVPNKKLMLEKPMLQPLMLQGFFIFSKIHKAPIQHLCPQFFIQICF